MSGPQIPMDDYQKFIATSRYARWLPTEKRREDWEETVERYLENVVAPRLFGRIKSKCL